MAIGKQIRHYREKLKWTLQRLSDASDVDVGTISALEIRDSSRSKFFPPIAKALGLTLEQLSNEAEDYSLSPPSQMQPLDKYPFRREAPMATKVPTTESAPLQALTLKMDIWTQAALEIMRELDEGQRQAMVAKMREYKQFLGPPRDGQALSVAS